MDELWTLLLILAILVIAVLLVGYLLIRWLMNRKANDTHKDEAHQFVGVVLIDPRREDGGELPYTGDYFPGTTGKNAQAPHLIVTLAHSMSGDFTVLIETWFDRFCKRIGLAKEIQTNDSAFDDAYYIQTDSPEFIRTFLADRDKRLAIQKLFQMGFQKIDHDGETLTATWTGYSHGSEGCEHYAHGAAEALVVLTRHLPSRPPISHRRRRTLSRKSLQWVGWTGVALGIGLFIGMFIAMSSNSFVLNHWGLFGSVLSIVGLVLLVYLWLAAWLVRGHSTSHLQLFNFFLAGIFVIPPLGVLGTERLNVWLDTSEPQEHVETIANKRSTKNKNSYTYYVQFPAWEEPGRSLECKVNSLEYNQVTPGTTRIKAKSRSGWLGFEYIDSMTIENPPLVPRGLLP